MNKEISIFYSASDCINLTDYNASSLTITIKQNMQASFIYDDQSMHTLNNIHFIVNSNAILDCVLIVTHAQQSTINITVTLDGNYGKATILGLYALSESQQLKITTAQYHNAPNTTSTVIIKGMLNQHAQADYQGKITIHKNAKHAHALQENKNILLSSNARAHSIPALEVLTNEVTCKHGSAVGYLDEQLLFYIQSRALDMQLARRIFLHGFFDHILQSVNIDMQDEIYNIIRKKSE